MVLPPRLSLVSLTIAQIRSAAFHWVWVTPPNKLQEEIDLEQTVTLKNLFFPDSFLSSVIYTAL